MLKYEDVSKLEGLGWIEYGFIKRISYGNYFPLKLSIEVNSINMVYFLFYLLFRLIFLQNKIEL